MHLGPQHETEVVHAWDTATQFGRARPVQRFSRDVSRRGRWFVRCTPLHQCRKPNHWHLRTLSRTTEHLTRVGKCLKPPRNTHHGYPWVVSRTVQHSAVHPGTVQWSTAQYTAQCNTVLYCVLHFCTVPPGKPCPSTSSRLS